VLGGNPTVDGRTHPQAEKAVRASPPLVGAYAIAGTIRLDIEQAVLGTADGREIRLKDIWPRDAEIDAVGKSAVKPEQFRRVYEPMFKIAVASGEAVSPLYDWRPQSTYIRRPPYWADALAKPRTLRGMRPLAVLGANSPTDPLSPSTASPASRAPGAYPAQIRDDASIKNKVRV